MVSLLIKKHDFAVFFTKTHHLKTLYIMAKSMAVEATFLPAEGCILPYKFIINGLGGNMAARHLSGEKPVIFRGRCVFPPDIFLQDRDNTVSQDSITVRTVLAFGNIDMFLRKIDVPTMKAAEFTDADAGRIQ